MNKFGLIPGLKLLLINSVNTAAQDIDSKVKEIKKCITESGSIKVVTINEFNKDKHEVSYFDVVLSGILPPYNILHDTNYLGKILSIVKPGGRIVVTELLKSQKENNFVTNLKLAGLIDIHGDEIQPDENFRTTFMEKLTNNKLLQYEGLKPNFEIGSSTAIKLDLSSKNVNNSSAVWKLNDIDDDIIDSDQLLDEDDLKKPDATVLKVCGTTGKRKACKNCTCGLTKELELEQGKGEPSVATTQQTVKASSCGNCYLGDAFRCASCPYLGMPAFKPGEKIQLTSTQLSPDV